MNYNPNNPLIVQSDGSLLLETNSEIYEDVRDYLQQFAELIKSPEYVHTYRITPLSIWNAASAGIALDYILSGLSSYCKFPVPDNIVFDITEYYHMYGKLQLVPTEDPKRHCLKAVDPEIMNEILHQRKVKQFLEVKLSDTEYIVQRKNRGWVKEALIKVGYPVEDLVGYDTGEALDLNLQTGDNFQLRKYQNDAVDSFYSGGASIGTSGVIVLPCGSGKTIIGIALLAKYKTSTLIIVNNIEAARQWKREILDKTDLSEDMIGQYHSGEKEIKPVTIATYNIITYKKEKKGPFLHMDIFDARDWGLIVYDEVHLLPAPVFQFSAGLQAKRRLGLTATLIREDGREDEVFSLIGPKKFDVPWKVLERQGWIAKAECSEIRIPLNSEERKKYIVASDREKFRIASCNTRKVDIVWELLMDHEEDNVLVIGQYIAQLKEISERYDIPLITGSTNQTKRAELYGKFRSGEIKHLVVSKVANFSIDLPDANVAIQVSGTFGSRQEEAQRLGRIMRPKSEGDSAHFYSLVSKDTSEQVFAMKRQLFLTEQGYRYCISNY